MSKPEEDILIGMKQIQCVLGGASESTIIRWKQQYPSMPMKKNLGQWTSSREELCRWWRFMVCDALSSYTPLGIEHQEAAPMSTRGRKKAAAR